MYLNNDGKLLFGTPWEMMFVDSYLVRTKAGGVLGYSSMFSFAPDLGLGKVCCEFNNDLQFCFYQGWLMQMLRLPMKQSFQLSTTFWFLKQER